MSLDPLEDILEALTEEARRDSSGVFSLDPRKALEKFAAFQLQGEQWALKVVQAAVAAGATSLDLTFRGTEAVWKIKGPAWSSQEIESALWHPERIPRDSIHALRIALWNVGFGRKTPFSLDGPAWNQRLRWDGRRFHRDSPSACQTVELRVSQTRPASLQALLLNLAYPCPIPFTMAGRSLKKEREGAHLLFSGYPCPELFCQLFVSKVPCAGSLFWVKDGVIVGMDFLRGQTGTVFGDFYLSDPKAPTDLTGLALVEELPAESLLAVNQLLADSIGRLHNMLLEREGEAEPPRLTDVGGGETLGVIGVVTMLGLGLTEGLGGAAFGLVILLGGILGMRLNPPKVSPRARRGQELTRYIGMLKDHPWQLSRGGDSS